MKKRSEHIMLVDLARDDLGRVAKHGSVEVEPYNQLNTIHVMHIVSGVQGNLEDDKDTFDLFAAASCRNFGWRTKSQSSD